MLFFALIVEFANKEHLLEVSCGIRLGALQSQRQLTTSKSNLFGHVVQIDICSKQDSNSRRLHHCQLFSLSASVVKHLTIIGRG